MDEKKTEQATLRLSPRERIALERIAQVEDRKQADVLRRLIRREAQARGLWRAEGIAA